jgi:hypothetical protein
MGSICQLMRSSPTLGSAKVAKPESGGAHFPARFFAYFQAYELQGDHGGKERKYHSMHPLIQLKKSTPIFIALALVCVGLSPSVQAVSPAPDGAYPNFTTAEGDNALFSLTTGAGNTGLGWRSLFSDTTGNSNTGIGGGALALNNGDSNTAVGAAALLLNTSGTDNTAVGTGALVFNDTGSANSAVGTFALNNNIDGSFNSAFGGRALTFNVHANYNTAIGNGALLSNDITGNSLANSNTAVGNQALLLNRDGNSNTAVGADALGSNTIGDGNSAIGADSLHLNTTGSGNTANGLQALLSNTIGGGNTAEGIFALFSNTGGNGNTAMGNQALSGNIDGSSNVALGDNAGSNATTGSGNVYIGAGMRGVAGESDACYIRSIFGQMSAGGIPVLINADQKLGTLPSSKRFKQDIKPMDKASDTLFALKPVVFRYKKEIDPAGTSQLGLVAEDVEKVNRDLVVRDKEGKPYSVRYDQVNAMLLNEFLKEHRKVEQLTKDFESKLAEQQTQIQQLTAQIQKVRTQVEVPKSAPQTVVNYQ